VDVMKNVPSVQVDIDGNVTLRNSSPTSRRRAPTSLTLDQIPADASRAWRLLPTPAPNTNASGGTSGILNIVLKKNRKAGYNGNVRAGVDQRGRINGGGDINVKQGKFNVFANGFIGQRKSISPGTTTGIRSTTTALRTVFTRATTMSIRATLSSAGSASIICWTPQYISFSGNLVHGHFNPYTNSDLYVDTLYPGNTQSSYTRRLSTSTGDFRNHGGMLSYKHTFPKSGEELTADVNYSKGTNTIIT